MDAASKAVSIVAHADDETGRHGIAVGPSPSQALGLCPTPTLKGLAMSAYVVFARSRTTDAQELANYRSKGPQTLNDRPARPIAFYGELHVLAHTHFKHTRG
jgi:hypothetical protein